MIISVFGKNGAGKTSISIHLAKAFAQKNNFVSIVSLEMRYGSLQRSIAVDVAEEKSIINILTQENIKDYFTRYEDNIYIASLANTDDITKYDAINNLAKDDTILAAFIKKLNSCFDITIIDLTELIIDPFTFFVIKNSDYFINVTESRADGLAFANSHKEIIASIIDNEKVINVINKHDEAIVNLNTIKSIYGDVDVCIDFNIDDIKKERENQLSKNLLEKGEELMKIIEKRNGCQDNKEEVKPKMTKEVFKKLFRR